MDADRTARLKSINAEIEERLRNTKITDSERAERIASVKAELKDRMDRARKNLVINHDIFKDSGAFLDVVEGLLDKTKRGEMLSDEDMAKMGVSKKKTLKSSDVLRIADKPTAYLVNADIQTALTAILADPRTVSATHALNQFLDVDIQDTRDGRLVGRFSIGRVLHAMEYTEAEWKAELQRIEAEKLETQARVARAREVEAENIRFLEDRGVSVDKLALIRGKIQRGEFIRQRDWETYDIFTDAFCGGVCRTDIEAVLTSPRPGA